MGRPFMFFAWAVGARKWRAGRSTETFACCLLAWGSMLLLKLGLQHVRVAPRCGQGAPTLDISWQVTTPKPLYFVQRSPLQCIDATRTTETSQGVTKDTSHYHHCQQAAHLGQRCAPAATSPRPCTAQVCAAAGAACSQRNRAGRDWRQSMPSVPARHRDRRLGLWP